MDSLVALSTSVAYFYSHYLLLQARLEIAHDQLYFDTIAMVLTVILLGKLLEAKAKGRALKDLNELYGLQIRLVRVRKGQGEEWIPAERLRKGEEVIVEAGEWISADGKIIAGSAEADEALLTGESAPALKSVGDDVYSGTRCLNGALRIRASCDASGTRLSRMIAMVENAQSVKPTLARKVDKAAAVFVPIMMLCAALTYAYWSWGAEGASAELAIRHSLSVLLIACPCALGLAAPVSILIATALAAKKGILFKDGGAMETLAKVDRLLFDKTGTLTEGKPRLKAIQTTRYSKAYLLRMVAAVERQSAHLLAEAIMETAERQGIVVPDAAGTMEIPGGGVQGLVEGKQVRVGHRQWIASAAGEVPDTDANFGELSADGAATVLYVTIEGRHSGALLLSDTLRSEAAEVMAKLKPAAKLSIVTGDQPSPAYAIARQAGIEEVRAGCSPERKAAVVEEERQGGHIVAFVGDGNNDAAALAAADVGIAMGGGAGAAMQVGDIVLARNRLSGIADAFRLSKAALKNIKQNIAFAIVYNTAAVPLAAAGYLDPKIACLGMAASSVLVVSNALRLQSVALAERGRE
jgi:Cu+-exporting ATPase